MEITDIKIRKANKTGRMKAIISVTFDCEFVVHDIKVIEGDNGLFIAMPSRKTSDGRYRDIAHPISSDTRNKIQSTVLERCEIAFAEMEAAADTDFSCEDAESFSASAMTAMVE